MVVGRAYPRKRFGVNWLLLQTGGGVRTVLIPAEQMQVSGEHLVLPYSRTYVEGAPAFDENGQLSKEGERRLRLHYGIISGAPDGGCRAGCGLCMVNRRELLRGNRECGGDDES